LRRLGEPVGQDSQDGEQLRPALHFVNHNEAVQTFQCCFRLLQAREAHGIFQIKVIGGIYRDKFSGDGGFATLSWANEGHDPATPERHLNGVLDLRTENHTLECHEKQTVDIQFSLNFADVCLADSAFQVSGR